MEIKVITNPDAKIRQKALKFLFHFMGSTKNEIEEHEDRWGTIPFGYVIAYDKNKIISIINLFKRKIKFKKHNILMGGIGSVCTRLEYRRQGVSTNLLEKGMETLKHSNCDIAFLCANIKKLAPLYSKVGFTPLKRYYKATGESGKIYRSRQGMIAPVKSKKVFKEILEDRREFDMQGQDW